MKKQSGFTLVEIAIVLVIIGLLLGGALKGQELIENAKINRVKSDFDQISAAIYSYQDRYRALPGDDASADDNVGSAATGNGDGLIGGNWASTNNANESRMIWDHLRRAGFITGTGFDQPTHAYGGRLGINNDAYGMQGMVLCMDNLDGEVARIIDLKFDDGIPNAGNVRAHNTQTAYVASTNYDPCFEM